MPKRRRLSGTEVCRILETGGFRSVRQRGSHVVMQRKTDRGTITVPIPMHDELKPGTLGSIVRQSRLSSSLFE